MQPTNIKAYGNVSPASVEMLETIKRVCKAWCCDAHVTLTGDLLRFAYEGIFFPIDDIVEALRPFLKKSSTGKIDIMDMDAWTLTRYMWPDGVPIGKKRNLNDVLAYSGL